DFLGEKIDGELRVAGHRGDGLPGLRSVADEHGQDQVAYAQFGFAHQLPQDRVLPQAAHPQIRETGFGIEGLRQSYLSCAALKRFNVMSINCSVNSINVKAISTAPHDFQLYPHDSESLAACRRFRQFRPVSAFGAGASVVWG